MGKLSNCLQMLLLLKSSGKMQVSELAEKLEVNERSIRSYKSELEKVGIYIESTTGLYGGYYLSKDAFFPILNLTEMEMTAMLRGLEFLKANKGFLHQADLKKAMEKVIAQSKLENLDFQNHMIQKSTPNIDTKEYKKIYLLLDEGIQEKKKIKMHYIPLSNKGRERVLHPYELFLYQGFWYVVGFCEHRGEIRSFKLNRISRIDLLDESFEIQKGFILENHVGKNTIYKVNEVFIRLKIQPPMSTIISEYIWCEDQNIYPAEEEGVIFEGTFPLSPETRTWVLSMGSQVEIIEPMELKKQIREEIEKMWEKYQ